MTDTGAVIRAIKMGFEDGIICDTLNITQGTLDIIKTDYNNIKQSFDVGRKYDDAAALLMKDPAEVWYAYHVFESDNKTLEDEILAENEGKPRLRPSPVTKKKIGVEGVTKEIFKKAPKKNKTASVLTEETEGRPPSKPVDILLKNKSETPKVNVNIQILKSSVNITITFQDNKGDR